MQSGNKVKQAKRGRDWDPCLYRVGRRAVEEGEENGRTQAPAA